MLTSTQINSIRGVVPKVLNRYVHEVPDLIRKRLWTDGTYSDGSSIVTYKAQPPYNYSPATVRIKNAKGQPTDRVTLKDTGGFYRSIKAEATGNGYTVEGDTDIFQESVEDKGILELSEDDLNKLSPKILLDVQKEIKAILLS